MINNCISTNIIKKLIVKNAVSLFKKFTLHEICKGSTKVWCHTQ